MFRLQFQLTPLEHLPEDWQRNWFFLTDGFYWIETDPKELFRYSETQLEIWKGQGDTDSLPYTHYPIARFWHDFLDVARFALCPVPDDIFAWVKDATHWSVLEAQVKKRLDITPYPSPEWDALFSITHWWAERRLNSFHLAFPPDIWLYRVNDTLFLRWETGSEHAGPPVGEVPVPIDDFLKELRRFDTLLTKQMQKRILMLPHQKELQQAHDANKTMLQDTLDYSPYEDWDAIRAAYKRLREEQV